MSIPCIYPKLLFVVLILSKIHVVSDTLLVCIPRNYMPSGRASPTLSCATMDRRVCCCCLLAVALTSYLVVVTESCPSADSVSPATGSADPSFVYTISGAGLTDVNVTSPAGSLNYTAVNDSTIRFSFETGSSAMGRVVVRVTAPLCSAVDITVLVTIPCK